MKTVIETPTFTKQAARIWSDEERMDFIDFIASNPTAGDVIPGAEGARKIRWTIKGRGKRGGARVIYFNITAAGTIILLTVYTKAKQDTINPQDITRLKNE